MKMDNCNNLKLSQWNDYCHRCCLLIDEILEEKEMNTTLEVQVDGDHYKNFPIQPAVYSYTNKLNWHQGEIIKYITRYNLKNGKKDLEKAKHLIEMLIELEYDSP